MPRPRKDKDDQLQLEFHVPSHLFGVVCRVCLQECRELFPIHEIALLHNISSKEPEKIGLVDVFRQYCNIQIESVDRKPQQICTFCIDAVRNVFGIFQTFIESDKLLNKVLEKELLESSDVKAKDEVPGSEEDQLLEVDEKHDIKFEWSDENNFDNDEDLEDDRDDDYNPEEDDDEVDLVSRLKKEKGTVEKTTRRRRGRRRKQQHDKPVPRVVCTLKDGTECFICKYCSQSFTEVHKIVDHFNESHKDGDYCPVCWKPKTRFINYHISLHSKSNTSCRQCRVYFPDKEQFEEHMDTIDHNNPLYCNICQKEFRTKWRRKMHMVKHYGDKSLMCQQCGMRFKYETSLRRHNRVHLMYKEFLCNVCGKGYTTKIMMQRHVASAHDEKVIAERQKRKTEATNGRGYVPRVHKKPRGSVMQEIKCEYCDEVFPSKPRYARHRQLHPEFCDYPCKVCKKQFTTKETLKEHIDTVHCRFLCELCGKGFPYISARNQHYNEHKEIHIGKVRCDVCYTYFANKHCLKDHMRTHTGEKPYKCEVCGKCFKQQSHLNIHSYQHTGTKPHKCHLCEKSFSFRAHLVSHVRVHTGERPYPCNICSKSFRDSTILHKHKKKTHPDEFNNSRNVYDLSMGKIYQDEEIDEPMDAATQVIQQGV